MSGVQMTKLYDERHPLYCARGHDLFDLPVTKITETTVSDHAFVARNYGSLIELERFPSATVGALSDHMEIQAMFILSGEYIGYLPDHFAKDRVARGELRCLLNETASINSQFVLATRTGQGSAVCFDCLSSEFTVVNFPQSLQFTAVNFTPPHGAQGRGSSACKRTDPRPLWR